MIIQYGACALHAGLLRLPTTILSAFPCQQRLGEQASMLRLYIHCLSCLILNLGFMDLQNQLMSRSRVLLKSQNFLG